MKPKILIRLSEMVNNTILEPFSISKNENTEFERGIYKIFVTLYAHEDGTCTEDPKLECESDYIRKSCEPMVESKEDFRLLDVGSVWTFMVTANETHCSPKYARDLAPNEISILWLLPEWRKIIRIRILFKKMRQLPLRSKKAGKFEKFHGFARGHTIVTPCLMSLSCATTPHTSCFS